MSRTTTSPSEEEPEIPGTFNRISASEQFGPQWTRTLALPNPQIFVKNFTLRALEILYGSRELAQLSRWATEDVFLTMQKRVNARIRKNSHLPVAARSQPTHSFALGNVRMSSPRDGVVEACLLVKSGERFQTAALRIEGWDHRWKTTAFAYL
jgi:hypothetical protein